MEQKMMNDQKSLIGIAHLLDWPFGVRFKFKEPKLLLGGTDTDVEDMTGVSVLILLTESTKNVLLPPSSPKN